jgi:hypothetical protein
VAHRVIRNAPETVQNCELLCGNCLELTHEDWRPVGAAQSRA